MQKKTVISFFCLTLAAFPSILIAENNVRGVQLHPISKTLVAANETTLAEQENLAPDAITNVKGEEIIIIDGDRLDFDLDRKMNAYGNAIVTQGEKSISGDEIHYDLQNDELEAIGNTHIELGDGHVSGPSLKMRLGENIGEIKGASIKLYKPVPGQSVRQQFSSEAFSQSLSNYQNNKIGGNSSADLALPLSPNASKHITHPVSSRADAETILFEGQNKKHLKNARYSTCEANVDDWYIKAKDLKLNDYTESGVAKNAWVEFKGVPILYTPWLSFSYNQQRKSGFLAPTYGTTTNSGLELMLPYYWNISPNKDATLATRYLSKRGIQLQGEFRYLFDNYSGIANLEYLPNDDQTAENRHFISLKHNHQLGNGWSASYNYEHVSDAQYFSDMSTRIITTSRILLPQNVSLNWRNELWTFSGKFQKFQSLSTAFPYERMPQLSLNRNEYIGNWHTNLDTQLVSFKSSNIVRNPTEGVRTMLYPSISYELIKPYGYVKPKFGVHYTNYNLNNNDSTAFKSQSRTLPIASVDAGLYFDRDFKFNNANLIQTLEPRLFYVYIPDREQSTIPVFDSGLADLNFTTLFNENQFTGNDRINNANQVSFGISTRFLDANTGKQRLSASIGQRYYFADQVVTLPNGQANTSNSSDILAGVTASFIDHFNVSAFWQYNTEDDKSVRTTISGRYNPAPGKSLNMSYSYRQNLINQIDLSGQWPLGGRWYGVGRFNYSFFDDDDENQSVQNQSIESLAGLEYDAGCWVARTVVQRVRTATSEKANYALFFQLELGGIASIGSNPLTVIRRNVPGYIQTKHIPDQLRRQYYE